MVKEQRNPRAFKVWDTEYLYTTMVTASELKQSIESIASTLENGVYDMQPISVPAEMLWLLTQAYTDAYEKLLKEALITSGNISKIQPTLN